MDKMDKLIMEIALKAKNILDISVFECEKNTNPISASMNAEFNLGRYFALMDIVKDYSMEIYVSIVESTKEARDKLSNITNNIYSV